jgi:hypothetical protein
MRTLKIAFAITLAYVVATGYGVWKALTWRP